MSIMKTVGVSLLVAAFAGQAYGYGYHVWGYGGYYPHYPVYAYPPQVVYAPPPVVYAPPPVVYEAPPVVYQSEPVYVEAPVVRIKRGEADIDSLKAKGYCRPEGLEIQVRYEVELERLPLGAQELIIQFVERGRVIVDEEGNPIVIVAALDQPTDVDDDEVEFKGRISTLLPNGTFFKAKRIRADAMVIDIATGGVMDRKTEEVDD